MDPSIMKLLEEDEDETMHSGADVDAFTAALNRDIEGDASTSQPSDDTSNLSQESSYTSNQFVTQWQTSSHDENENTRSQQDHMVVTHNEPQSTEMDLTQHGSVLENQKPPVDSFTSQVDQNVLNVSQAMALHDSKNVLGHNQGPVKMQNLDHDPNLAKLQNKNSQQPSNTGHRSQLAVAMGSNKQQAVPPGGSNQPATNTVSSNLQASNLMRGKQVPFAVLLPVIQPQLDKDRAMQLNTLYHRLRKNEISKDGFVRLMRSIVGDQMLKMAVYKISQAAKSSQNVPNQLAPQSQALSQQQFPTSSSVQMVTDSSNQTTDGDAPASREVERQSDSHEMQASQMPSSNLILKNQDRNQSFPLQGFNKQQQQPMHFSQPAYPAFGGSGSNYHPHSTTNTNSAAVTAKQQPHDFQMRQIPTQQSIGTAQLGATNQGINVMNVPKFDQKRLHAATNATNSLAVSQKGGGPSSMNYIKQEPTDQSNEHYKQFPSPHGLSSLSSVHPEQGNAIPEPSKDESFEMGFTVPASSIPSNSISSSTQTDSKNSLNSKITAANSEIALGNNIKSLPKKPSVSQKKPLETLGSPPLPPSKKQKVSGAFLDQSIEHLNDVTAVSGVDLREEEEQLLSGPKEDSRVSEASRRVVQEEEERLLLEKVPLQQKLAKIMAKNGIKNMSNDVERCLSLAVEERLRGLIYSLIRLSKQREEVEKLSHNTVITSDVGAKIRSINQKAREEWEKKQAEAEKLQRLNEPESNHPAAAVDGGEKDKDESRGGKAPKANKEEDDKMRTTAANVAARAAVGGDDMLSKWQLMAEQAKQKRFGGTADASSSSSSSTSTTAQKVSSSSAARKDDSPEAADKKGGQSASSSSNLGGAVRKVGRNQVNVPQQPAAKAVPSNISLKDLIFVFEREPQMAKSVLLYKLYDRIGNPPE